jgi:putative ABC transport system permease protein
MKGSDAVGFALRALSGQRLRTALVLLAMAIGVAAVVVLTALGDGARRYVVNEFSALGSHLLIVLPGKTETSGMGAALMASETPRDLTLDDAQALQRHSQVNHVAPVAVGTAAVSRRQRERDVTILGTSNAMQAIRHLKLAQGRFLPAGDLDQARPVCVIGGKIREELFGADKALGQWLRIGDRRFRVVGILASSGRSLGMDPEDSVIIPVASAQSLFNTSSLFRILVEAKNRETLEQVKTFAVQTLRERHQGIEDVTVVSQDAVLKTFDRILQALTLTLAGIAAISLAVAGILIMNIMLISITQRRAEVGLLKALGAASGQILRLFLTEAALLSLLGAFAGVLIGLLGTYVIGRIYPDFPLAAPPWAIAAAVAVSLVTGLVFGVMPARRAARLNPVQALMQR